MRLRDRIAIVTGAAGGIGEAVAHAFSEQGATVIAVDMQAEKVAETAAAITAKGGRASSAELNVTDVDAVRALVAKVVAEHGRLDILANIAGIGSFGHFNDVTPEEFDRVMRVNVTGTFNCAQAAAREMVKTGYGRIINVASISGARAGEHRTAYGTSKAAVIGLTRQGARDLAPHGITVNAIGPGPVDTPLTAVLHSDATRENYHKAVPAGRYGTVAEMADAVVFLAGEAAGYVNGHILFVDGGYTSAGVAEVADS
jgi:3-oxoacyl-[acyl-carrier protein] reductase